MGRAVLTCARESPKLDVECVSSDKRVEGEKDDGHGNDERKGAGVIPDLVHQAGTESSLGRDRVLW